MKDASGEVHIDPDGMRASAEALYGHRHDTFKPEVERIRGITWGGIEAEARRESAVQIWIPRSTSSNAVSIPDWENT